MGRIVKSVEVGGVVYKSIQAACDALGLCRSTVYKRMKGGSGLADAIERGSFSRGQGGQPLHKSNKIEMDLSGFGEFLNRRWS